MVPHALAALGLLLSLASAQAQPEQVFPLPLFTEGLYTRYSANMIPDGALSEALNVYLDEDVDGVVVLRRGIAKYNATAITNTKSVRGLWQFNSNDGTRYLIAFSSSAFYRSVGDGVFTAVAGLSGYSSSLDFDCVTDNGKFWCTNSVTTFYYDGTSTATVSGAPNGTLIGTFRNRILEAGITAARSNLRLSGELDGTDWTVQTTLISTVPTSLQIGGTNDGNAITCLMGQYHDIYLIGKKDSLWGLYGFDRRDFAIRQLSSEVGCIEQHSVQEKNNCKYWMSKRGIEKFCGTSLERVSDPIRDQIDIIIANSGNTVAVTHTSQSDFEAGNLTASGAGAPMSTTISPGNLTISSVTRVDSSSANFGAGTLSFISTNSSPAIYMTASSSATFLWDNWTETPVYVTPRWTNPYDEMRIGYLVNGTSVTINGTRLACRSVGPQDDATEANAMYRTGGAPTGQWQAIVYTLNTNAGVNVLFLFEFLRKDANNALWLQINKIGQGQAEIRLKQKIDGTTTNQGGMVTWTTPDAGMTYFTINRDTNAYTTVYRNGISIITSTTSNTFFPLDSDIYIAMNGNDNSSTCSNPDIAVSTISIPFYVNGVFFSQTFDMSLSTPVGGPLTVTSTTAPGTSLAFQVRSAAASVGPWSAWSTLLNGERINLQQQYWQYLSSMTTSISTQTPRISNVSLEAATTGYFISNCFNPGSNISQWGTFQCNQVLNNGETTLYISTGSSCNQVTRTTVTWNTQINNSVIAVATSTFAAYRVLFSVDAGTETPMINDCTMNWQEGATRPPVGSSVYRDRYYLAYTSSTASGAANDHFLVLDKNDKWTLFDGQNCYSLMNYERKLYCGASTASGQVWLNDIGTDNDGSAIHSRIKTKAFNLGATERRKTFRKLYLDIEPSTESTSSSTISVSYSLDRGTVTYSIGSANTNEDPGYLLTPKFPFLLTNPVDGRFIQVILDSNQMAGAWRLFGSKLYYSVLDPE